jgi:signal transduction histidine kinase
MANALRFAPARSSLELGVRRSGGWVEIWVADHGPGIDPANHDNVFQRFWRGDDVGAGSGLGLSIVRRIAERHGGSVHLESEVGRGARFTIRLPGEAPGFTPPFPQAP